MHTAHDGLPSPEHLTPISGHSPPEGVTPTSVRSPMATPPASTPISRNGSQLVLDGDEGTNLRKVPSRGGMWHDHEVSNQILPSRHHTLCFGPFLLAMFPASYLGTVIHRPRVKLYKHYPLQ